MKKFLILSGGWTVTIVGALLTPIPLPLPFPLGIMMFLVGCAILTTHSKAFRRLVQYLRHHNGWLSRGLEFLTRRAPKRVKTMEEVTRPLAFGRQERMRARRGGETA
ncbi:MAG TPA: hypothetical protein VGI20_03250 [Rhizomicrobium sp.]